MDFQEIEVFNITPPNFILEQQAVSNMKTDIFIQNSIEVAEVKIAVSGGHRSGQGPDEKKLIKNYGTFNF